MEVLAEHDFDNSCWWMLGLRLGLKNSALQGIAADHGGNSRPNAQTHALTDILSRWMRQDVQASWEKLVTALKKCGHTVIANQLK